MKGESSDSTGALVLFSGGQDSTVCLAWALSAYERVETVGFDYGQRHGVELDCRARVLAEIGTLDPAWDRRLGKDHTLELPALGRVSDTALTRDTAIEMADTGLPTTFVPGRNLLFFTYAAALGYRRGLTDLVGGMCETDYSGYPDCRDRTLQSLAEAIRLGTETEFSVVTPLMRLSKAETWAYADALGGARLVELIVEHTHSCYKGERTVRHDWGYGCDACPACALRAKGFEEWRASAALSA